MKLSKAHFIKDLETKLGPIYSFFAEESIQISELAGFDDKQTHIITKDTDWSFLSSENENFDLFGSKKIVEIKLIGTGPGNKGSKAIKDYCLDADENKLLIISAERLEKKQQTSAWAKALDESGIFVVEPPVNKSSMHIWIKAKASSLNLNLDVNYN